MTSRSFDLARLSFSQFLDNIVERNPKSSSVINCIRKGMDSQEDCVALCSEKQASVLARSVVYNYIGDDLNFYPITAEKKLLRTKVRKQTECNIPLDEMTVEDILYVAAAITRGESISKSTMRAVFKWFQEIGLDPIQARVFSILFWSKKPISIKAIPQHDLFLADYRKAAKALVEKGFVYEMPGGLFCVTEMSTE